MNAGWTNTPARNKFAAHLTTGRFFLAISAPGYNQAMPQSRIFPFRRVSVDHMVRGTTRVWWQLEPGFNEPGTRSFQLQYGRTGLRDAADWTNIGDPVVDGYVAGDPTWHEGGYDLLGHYRVVLTTDNNTYVSQAADCRGDLTERDWILSREIIRKEELRNRLAAISGYLLKPYRFGVLCKRCRDPLTQEVTDSNCALCAGTGFEVGYHPPLAMQCWDLSPQSTDEHVDSQLKGTTRENAYVTARVIGFPALNNADIWVNSTSDERWMVESVQVAAAIRGVPVVYNVKMGLVPFNNTVYTIEVGGEAENRPGPVLPVEGCGAVLVDHNYGGEDNLIYTTSDGCAITGADVYIFTKTVFDATGLSTPKTNAIGHTTTRVNGRWTTSFNLDPGHYVVLFEKPGEFGPDSVPVHVVPVSAIKQRPNTGKKSKPNNQDDEFWKI